MSYDRHQAPAFYKSTYLNARIHCEGNTLKTSKKKILNERCLYEVVYSLYSILVCMDTQYLFKSSSLATLNT